MNNHSSETSTSTSNVPAVFDENATLILSEEDKKYLISLAIKTLVTNTSRWILYAKDHTTPLNEKNFDGMWNDHPELRTDLISILISCYLQNIPMTPLTADFAYKKLIFFDSSFKGKDDEYSDLMRRRIVPVIYPNFDYKSEIIQMMGSDSRKQSVAPWIELASNVSKDQDLFEFLLSTVKREEGSTELKINIINKAFANGIVCENAIKKIANSAPISLKRNVVDGLANMMRTYVSQIRYRTFTFGSENILEEKITKIENLAMLFAGLDDPNILRVLGSFLSIKNLPWILPAAAKHPWIANDIQRRIDRGV
jgi:hypothetical protein